MTEETRKLFDAPWKTMPEDHGIVQDVNGAAVAKCVSPAVANAFSSLPELYDALVEAVNDACQDCVDETYELTGFLFDPANDGCVYPERDCCPKCRSWIALLRKVRDAK